MSRPRRAALANSGTSAIQPAMISGDTENSSAQCSSVAPSVQNDCTTWRQSGAIAAIWAIWDVSVTGASDSVFSMGLGIRAICAGPLRRRRLLFEKPWIDVPPQRRAAGAIRLHARPRSERARIDQTIDDFVRLAGVDCLAARAAPNILTRDDAASPGAQP